MDRKVQSNCFFSETNTVIDFYAKLVYLTHWRRAGLLIKYPLVIGHFKRF